MRRQTHSDVLWAAGLAILSLASAWSAEQDRPRLFSFLYYHDPVAEAIDYRIGVLSKLKVGPEDREVYEGYKRDYEALQEELAWVRPDWVRVSMILNGQLMVAAVTRPRLSPAELRGHLDQSAAKMARLRKRLPGAKFLHYLCQIKISGDPEKRTGMFALYDHWDEYAALGLGPRPKRPMVEWVQRRGQTRKLWRWAHYSLHESPCYMLCPNAPETRQLRAAQVRLLAESGVDGIFVDNPMMCCLCDICMDLFRKRLAHRYSPEERRRFFGQSDVSRLELAADRFANSPIAVETLHFWTESCASMFKLYKETGEAVRGKGRFVISANGTPFEVEPTHCSNIGDWAHHGLLDNAWRECRSVALGRWDRPTGGPLVEVEHWDMVHAMLACRGVGREMYASPGYNYAFTAHIPLYELAAAEHWAFGGLFLVARSRAVYDSNNIDPFRAGDRRQRLLHDWFHRLRGRLWHAAKPASRVAVLASHNEWFVGNAQFEPEFRVLTELLEQAQIPFDILVDAGITGEALARYELAIAPCLTSLPRARHQAVEQFVSKGGRLFATGQYGSVNEVGCPRQKPLLDGLLSANTVRHQPAPFVTIGADPTCAVRAYDPPLYNRYGGKRHSPRLRLLAEVARKPFLDAVAKLIPGRLSLVRRADAPGLRSRLYAKGDPAAPDALVLHLVNYDVSSAWSESPVSYVPREGTRPTVRRTLGMEVTVPIPSGRRVRSITLFRPGEEDAAIEGFRLLADGVAFGVPDLYIYAVAEIVLEPGDSTAKLTLQDYCGGLGWDTQTARPYRRAAVDLVPVPAQAARAPARDAPGPLIQSCGYVFVQCRRAERVEGSVRTALNPHDERRLDLADMDKAMDMGDSAARWSERGEWVQYWVIDPHGRVVLQRAVRCGEVSRFMFEPETGGTYTIFVDAGTNFFGVEVPGRAAAMSAIESHRMVLQELPGRLHFLVPHGLQEVRLQMHCRDRNARLRFLAPDGVRLERALGSDFHPMARLSVPVKRADWGTIWALEVADKQPRWPMTLFFEQPEHGLVGMAPDALLMRR